MSASMVTRALFAAAAIAAGVQGAAVPKDCKCEAESVALPMRLMANEERCIVKADPQPKESEFFHVTLAWGPCGKDDEDAMLFRWNGA